MVRKICIFPTSIPFFFFTFKWFQVAFASERRKAAMLNFSIAHGKNPMGLAQDWKASWVGSYNYEVLAFVMILLPRHDAFHLLSQVSVKEAKQTVNLWYSDRKEVLTWQKKCKQEALDKRFVCTLLGRARQFPSKANFSAYQKSHIDIVGAAINTLVQVLPFFLTQSFMLTLSPLAV